MHVDLAIEIMCALLEKKSELGSESGMRQLDLYLTIYFQRMIQRHYVRV